MKPQTLWLSGLLVVLIAVLGYGYLEPFGSARELARQLDTVIADFHEDVNLGMLVVDLDSGATLYAKHPDRYFLPASNQKLLTAWAALQALPADFTYQTVLAADTTKIRAGTLQDNLYLTFSGDPTLTFTELDALVGQLAKAGVKRIAGQLVIDDTRFKPEGLSLGSTWDDAQFCYGAPVDSLTVDHNCVLATLAPALTPGAATTLSLPATPQFMQFTNQTRTDFTNNPACRITITRSGNTYQLTGCIKATEAPAAIEMAIVDPRANIQAMLRYLFLKYHIQVPATVVFQKVSVALPPLAQVASQPLPGLLAVMLKDSDNGIADALFKTLGQQFSGQPGSWENGGLAVQALLAKSLGVEMPLRSLSDGAGESRYIYHTPRQMMMLLQKAFISPYAPVFLASLAVAGVDGTLQERLQEPLLRGKIRAKTGTMSGVSALSGYLVTAQHHTLAFVIFINGFVDSPDKYEKLEDGLCAALITSA